jgi:two-component sensor histidine kinase
LSVSQDPPAIPLSEARHHMANVFQLLGALGRLRAQRSEDAEAKRQVAWLNEAVAAQGVLQHRLLSVGGDDFAAFLADMLPHWRRRVGARPIEVAVTAEPVTLNEQAASAIAAVAHELVINALAHAFPDGRAGSVRIALAPDGERWAVLTVSDDGVGYSDASADKSQLGLWLIAALANQTKGALTTTHDAGVTVRLEFPTG